MLEEVLYDQPTGRLALVFELMDANLYELIRGRRHYLQSRLIQAYIFQLLQALDHMHCKGIFHRDIKPENILIESQESTRGLKLADFGSCRGIYSKQPYTEYISTRWYRAPECLLTDGYYGPEMDVWGAGCVFFEISSLYPLFPGNNELDQINRIHRVLGVPGTDLLQKLKRTRATHGNFEFPFEEGIGLRQLLKHCSSACLELLIQMLLYDAAERVSAREALRHGFFTDCLLADHPRTSGNDLHTRTDQTLASKRASKLRVTYDSKSRGIMHSVVQTAKTLPPIHPTASTKPDCQACDKANSCLSTGRYAEVYRSKAPVCPVSERHACLPSISGLSKKASSQERTPLHTMDERPAHRPRFHAGATSVNCFRLAPQPIHLRRAVSNKQTTGQTRRLKKVWQT